MREEHAGSGMDGESGSVAQSGRFWVSMFVFSVEVRELYPDILVLTSCKSRDGIQHGLNEDPAHAPNRSLKKLVKSSSDAFHLTTLETFILHPHLPLPRFPTPRLETLQPLHQRAIENPPTNRPIRYRHSHRPKVEAMLRILQHKPKQLVPTLPNSALWGFLEKTHALGANGSADAGERVRHGSNSPFDQYVLEGRMDQPPKTAFVRATLGHSGRRERGAVGNWRWQMSCWWRRELYLEMSWLGPMFADWKYPVEVSMEGGRV